MRKAQGQLRMGRELSLFVGTFTGLLAIINPLEVMPVYLRLLAGEDDTKHRTVARKACVYALMLCFFFLVFGTLMLRLFGVPLATVRVAGGLILMRIGFGLFMPSKPEGDFDSSANAAANIAFVPLAMPLMFGPGAIATIIGISSTIKATLHELGLWAAVAGAIVATMFVTYLCLANARALTAKIGPLGIDAATRIVGFFVAAIGVDLVFDGVFEALALHGFTTVH
jgi:multiple antibiotic resistance protein